MDKFVIKNVRGDIPITILVIGIIAVCILTIFSFYHSTSKQKESFVGAGLIETIYSIQEEIEFGKGENLNPFEKDGMKIDFGDEINAEYYIEQGWIDKKKKTLIEIIYVPE